MTDIEEFKTSLSLEEKIEQEFSEAGIPVHVLAHFDGLVATTKFSYKTPDGPNKVSVLVYKEQEIAGAVSAIAAAIKAAEEAA